MIYFILFFSILIRMKKLILSFFIIICPLYYANAVPDITTEADCNAKTPGPVGGQCHTLIAGCMYNEASDKCVQCPENTYCKIRRGNNDPTPCPDDYQSSALGSQNKESCYKTCSARGKIDNGYWKLDTPIVYYTDKNPDCEYTLVCNNQTNICGYHADGDECVSNIVIISADTKGERVRNYANATEIYYTKCNAGYTPNNKIASCGGYTMYKDCLSNTISCSDHLQCSGGTVKGEATLNTDGTYNYANCTCELTNQSIPNGTGTKSCNFTGTRDNPQWQDINSCTVIAVSSCKTGYCVKDDDATSCDAAPRGKYKDSDNGKNCSNCESGKTTDKTGATSKNDCGFLRGPDGTQFCDSKGCFTLPGSGFIKSN